MHPTKGCVLFFMRLERLLTLQNKNIAQAAYPFQSSLLSHFSQPHATDAVFNFIAEVVGEFRSPFLYTQIHKNLFSC